MDILNSLIGNTVLVFDGNEEQSSLTMLEGVLQKVDSDGILLGITTGEGKKLTYVKHFDYNQITVVEEEQITSNIMSAFQKKKNGLFDFERE